MEKLAVKSLLFTTAKKDKEEGNLKLSDEFIQYIEENIEPLKEVPVSIFLDVDERFRQDLNTILWYAAIVSCEWDDINPILYIFKHYKKGVLFSIANNAGDCEFVDPCDQANRFSTRIDIFDTSINPDEWDKEHKIVLDALLELSFFIG